MSDIVLLTDWLYCIDLFSCIAASLFNKLTYLLTYLLKPSMTSPMTSRADADRRRRNERRTASSNDQIGDDGVE